VDLTTSAPGKVFVVGEYAVILGRPAVVAAVTRRLACRIRGRPGSGIGSLRRGDRAWRLALWESEIADVPPELRFMAAAAAVAVRARGLRGLDIDIETESAIDSRAAKAGLGGSAAVVAATVAAVHALDGDELSEATLASRLIEGVLAHRLAQRGGSSADVVAATMGGLLWVEGLDGREWPRSVAECMAQISRSRPIQARRLTMPEGLALEVGATHRPAQSGPRAARFVWRAGGGDPVAQAWMDGMKAAVEEFAEGCGDGSPARLLAATRAGRRLLARLAPIAGIPIWTPELRLACRAVGGCGAVVKPSGAGGGDCVLAILDARFREGLREAWAQVGVEPLAVGIDPEGARLETRDGAQTDA
jgi:phosphomevalonate kinase